MPNAQVLHTREDPHPKSFSKLSVCSTPAPANSISSSPNASSSSPIRPHQALANEKLRAVKDGKWAQRSTSTCMPKHHYDLQERYARQHDQDDAASLCKDDAGYVDPVFSAQKTAETAGGRHRLLNSRRSRSAEAASRTEILAPDEIPPSADSTRPASGTRATLESLIAGCELNKTRSISVCEQRASIGGWQESPASESFDVNDLRTSNGEKDQSQREFKAGGDNTTGQNQPFGTYSSARCRPTVDSGYAGQNVERWALAGSFSDAGQRATPPTSYIDGQRDQQTTHKPSLVPPSQKPSDLEPRRSPPHLCTARPTTLKPPSKHLRKKKHTVLSHFTPLPTDDVHLSSLLHTLSTLLLRDSLPPTEPPPIKLIMLANLNVSTLSSGLSSPTSQTSTTYTMSTPQWWEELKRESNCD